VWYTATDVQVSERVGKAFEEKYPGMKVQVERAGSERVFQRISQEYGSNIHRADVIETSDAVHFVLFKRQGWLLPLVPAEVAKHWPAQVRDPDGQFAAYRAHLSVIGYNTNQVKKEEAPQSHADLLDRKWRNRIVKAHPGYSGTVMTGTHALSEALGWEFLEKLSQQRIMQVQSSTEPPKKLAQGERSVMADGNEYNMFTLKDGRPGGDRLRDGRHAHRHRPRRGAQERASSRRGEAVLRLSLPAGDATADQRRRRPAFLPPGGEGEGGADALVEDQAALLGPAQARAADRGDQEEVRAEFWDLTPEEGKADGAASARKRCARAVHPQCPSS
jgi:hypothetical protein